MSAIRTLGPAGATAAAVVAQRGRRVALFERERFPRFHVGESLMFDDPDPRHHAAWLVVSRNGGRTFSEPLLVAEHPEHTVYYWDQRLCTAAEPGGFTALFWSHDLAAKQDLSVHVRRGRLAAGTTTGEPPQPLPIPGQIAAPLELADGQLLAFVVDRGRPGTMTLWQSGDGGRTWPEASRLVVHVHDERAAVAQAGGPIDFAEYWEDMGKWSFGHPVLRLLPDGMLLAAWYAGTPDRMSIHWARISAGVADRNPSPAAGR